jgi:hypothetical protein
MTIRFLQTTPSDNPDAPFQAGQVIEVAKLTATVRGWLSAVRDGMPMAVVVPDEPQSAMVDAAERAVQPRANARRAT